MTYRLNQTAAITASDSAVGTSGLVSGMLMVIGIGWNAGLQAQPFHPLMVGAGALAFHLAPLVAVSVTLVRAMRPGAPDARKGRGLTIAALIALAFGVFSAAFSITHPHSAMGVHDINDLLPIAMLEAGAVLWLLRGRRGTASTRPTKAARMR